VEREVKKVRKGLLKMIEKEELLIVVNEDVWRLVRGLNGVLEMLSEIRSEEVMMK